MSVEPECDKLIKLTEGVKVHLDKMHSIISKMEEIDEKIQRVMKENDRLRAENKYLRTKLAERTDVFPRVRF